MIIHCIAVSKIKLYKQCHRKKPSSLSARFCLYMADIIDNMPECVKKLLDCFLNLKNETKFGKSDST